MALSAVVLRDVSAEVPATTCAVLRLLRLSARLDIVGTEGQYAVRRLVYTGTAASRRCNV